MSNHYANISTLAKYQDLHDKYNHPYQAAKNNNTYNSVIPLKVFQTWCTKKLPPFMQKCVQDLRNKNPEFQYFLFDENERINFIKDNFDNNVVIAYDTLIPPAYKADLWRLCVLYIHGGIYLDIKLTTINNFKLIELTENEHFVKDRLSPLTIYNAFMVCKPYNLLLLLAINNIVSNVETKYYGTNPLEPTGPIMLGNLVDYNKININLDMHHFIGGGYIVYEDTFVLSTEYDEYKEENPRKTHYGTLWTNKKIYK
jgi:mannosyltransferase OCH1-like enzyme